MEQKIKEQLKIIEKSTSWVNQSLSGEKQKNAYQKIVNCRRNLNKKRFALRDNPAAAMYGESQVGKSYLISSLLSEEGKPFGIKDENNNFYNFIEEINPPGKGSESTSLVSRFSVNYTPKYAEFPIKANLMTPADILLVLCDSFYNDINLKSTQNNQYLSVDEINSDVNLIKDKFKNRSKIQDVFCEDEVLDMKDYFENHFQKADKVIDSIFFNEISLIISKSYPNEWYEIFSLLWNKNEIFSNLFKSIISKYENINFAKVIYLPIESVLYVNGTLLDVKRLKELYEKPDKLEPNFAPETKVFLPELNQEINFDKSYLCAITAELVFSQSKSILESKPFLKETDLLDFPGARARLEMPLDAIEVNSVYKLYLRGKVAYLFNKYSEAEKINILIFCAKHEQTAQRTMPRLLNNWISNFIGDTPEKREQFISKSKISPLFVVGTFFNVNLQFDPLLDIRDNSSLNYRWLQRFVTTLKNEYFETENHSWFENWTTSKSKFQNIFLLRDFEKSETPSNIFRGYNANKVEIEEVIPENFPDFRSKLRQSFLEYDFVKNHFENPAESWDRAASINEDGTKLIIEKLSIAANNINVARIEKMRSELNEITQTLNAELMKYFHSNDKDEQLLKAKATAGDIQHKLDLAFSAEGIKQFGQLMKELMLDESSVIKLYRKKIDDIEHRAVVNMDKYSTYRIQVPVIENDTAESYFERLCVHYEKNTDEQKQKFKAELDDKKINIDDLISGNLNLIKNNAQQLAETLLEYWFAYITLNEKQTIQHVLVENDNSALQEISEMFQKLFIKLNIAKRIAEKIRRYVDGQNKTDLPYEIVADISAELLNKCINTVGYEYLDESEILDLQKANEKNNLGLVLNQDVTNTEKNIAELFDKIDNWTEIIKSKPEEMKTLPNYRNYISWYNNLKIGFVSICDIPNYDIAVNEKLGVIIKESETINY